MGYGLCISFGSKKTFLSPNLQGLFTAKLELSETAFGSSRLARRVSGASKNLLLDKVVEVGDG